jgi:hypothetical protein
MASLRPLVPACLAAAVLAAGAPAAAPTPHALTVEGPVTAIAADGGRTVFVVRLRNGCARVAVWTPPRAVTTLRDPRRCLRGDFSPREGTTEVALAGRRAAWVQTAGGNNEETTVWTATLTAPSPVLVAFEVRGDEGVGTAAGGVHGDGGLLVFSTSSRCEERDDGAFSACPTGFATGDVHRETVWRLAASAGACPDLRPRPPRLCARVRTLAEEQSPLTADRGRIVVSRRSGSLEVVDAAGRHVARFRFGPGIAGAPALHGNDLVVERRGALDVFDVARGEKTATWPLPAGARLQDLHGGVAAYVSGGWLHLLRIGDGARLRYARASTAQLEGAGLTYASGRTLLFVPRAQLPAQFRPLAG